MAKQLTRKFQWMRGCIADSFGLSENFVNDAIITNEQNKQKMDLFLDSEGPPKLMVYYQTPDTGSENDQNVIDARLFLTYGDSERIKDKAVWFLRNLPENKKKIDVNTGSSDDVLFGQITPNPVRILNFMIENVYDPLINSESNQDWGQTEEDARKQFTNYIEKFKKEVGEALKLMEPGKQHFEIKPEELNKLMSMSESERIQKFEEKFDLWIKAIETFLNSEVKQKNEGLDPGPKTELEFWRERMQTITNWSEQLKSKDFNMVKANLIKYKQNEGKKEGQENINKLMLSFQRLDLALTDRLNEAKDNVKYLSTLEKFIEPLYTGTTQQIIETLPALMNAIKMIHTIARFYNTSDKMTGLFIKITNQMIKNCKDKITPPGKKIEDVWKRDPAEVIEVLGNCIKLNREYKEAYKVTKQKMIDMPKGKTFDFSETQIFSKFDQFVKRLQKLIEVFSNIQQFDALARLNLEKMDVIINKFNTIRDNFKQKRKADLLDLSNSTFDKEYVSFNISISQLDTELQAFIDNNFSKSKSIEHSINLLKKFESTIKRDALKHNLTSKYNTILTNYASQLEAIQRVFNDQKADPPIVRNMPENAGKIIWSKHLYQKIAGPITKFPQNVIHSSEIKKYYGSYNTLGKMLTINQMWYYDLWVKEIERSKAALQTTLIVKHETHKKLYVNFDVDIMQLIREAKCLDRQGIPIPENARIILLQEEKFKMYYNELLYVLKEHERIVGKIKPICKNILAPHVADMELKLHPGMSTLTWTSMNIDSYLNHVHQGLNKLEQLIINVNDIIENRVENNLKNISKVSLVSLPHDNVTFTLETFVSKQEEYINEKRNFLTSKNLEIERAIDDLLLTILNYYLDPRIDPVKSEETRKIKRYYFWYLYNALLHATQNSLNSMKYRICGGKAGSNSKLNPFFEVDVQLSVTEVRLNPSLEQIQKAINKAATAVLKCSKTLYNWDQQNTDDDKKQSLYEMIAQDKEIVKVILLLTGSIQGTKNKINDFLSKFNKFEWLWKKSIAKSIKEFSKGSEKPQLTEYENQLKKFSDTDEDIDKIEPSFIIGAMQLKTQSLIIGLKAYTKQWKGEYAEDLHVKARTQLYKLNDHIMELTDKLSKTVVKDIDSLGIIMEKLEEIRAFQSIIDISLNPIEDMYLLLENFLPGGITDKDEMDARSYLRSNWSNLVDMSEKIGKNLSVEQTQYLKKLKINIKELVKDITDFRGDYEKNGPMVEGISPKEAIERLKRFDEQYEVREQQYKINKKGEELFGLQSQKYPALEKTKAELKNLKKLYDLYSEVIKQINAFQETLWVEVSPEKLAQMEESAKRYGERCVGLPKDLKEWQAYKELKMSIEHLKQLLPIIGILKRDSVRDRHWQVLNEKTEHKIPYDQPEIFIIEDLTKAKVLDLLEDIEEIGQSAEKQKKIELALQEIDEWWVEREFEFVPWGKRDNAALGGLRVQDITERLEEDQMTLSSINAQRHVVPFKKRVEELIRQFSDTGETLDLWIKVQKLWTSLEPVFTGGDIAKQMPLQAKQFAGIDKTWMKCMEKSFETKRVLQCCELDLLKDNLPDMQKKLEECQKLLEDYLERKRKLFPRFYFVSNPALLKILSQGSDPSTIQEDFEKLFDAITKVEFGKSDKKGSNEKTITTIMQEDGGVEKVKLTTPVKCEGNIESWLNHLEKEMQDTMREHCRIASVQVMSLPLEQFVHGSLSQVALMGIQLIWTQKITEALQKGHKENKGAMQAKKKEIEKMLQELTILCLQDIKTSLLRRKIETLVTIHVHQRDIAFEMKCQSVNDFEWQKQTRLYWKQEEDTCIISITDWQASYCYEFLGAKERLCVTPLTDRCYVTLAQAMSMFYGGSPAGPAGTGKTETVKDLGRGLGIFVVVTNCSDQHRYKDMAKIFKGLVQSGLWGCFDEFNRILLEVLSVVAMQVECIGLAKKQHVSEFMFPEEQYPIRIIHSVGYFITMNPGYAGRQELPENLKVLFRGVTMMVPDREIIIKVKLASVGYEFIGGLSKKFNILYKLCEEQLSKQRHYDFGLRNILSVLRTAGNTKRKETKPDQILTPEKKEAFEEYLLMRSLKTMNMSKLVYEDIELFEGLLKDIFPRQDTKGGKVEHKEVESRIPLIIKKRPELVNTASFTKKIIEVFETSEVRHGYMLLGLSATGKSTILQLLTETLSEIPDRIQYRIVKMNPKAITDQEMYGVKSQISDDWIPGVFSTLWQKCNDRKSKFNIWLTCDGPVDTIWIESLNTVLDDNKILTLANGERIPMSNQCKLVFEVENLNNASPATVSRCGQIYISPNDLGHKAIYEGWCNLRSLERSTEEATIIKKYLMKFFDEWKICDALEKTIKNPPMMQISLSLKLINTLNLINGLLRNMPAGSKLSDVDYEKVVVFAIAWAVGGLYEAAERFQFHEYLQSKNCQLPMNKKQTESIFDYYVHIEDNKAEYRVITPDKWKPSPDKGFKFSQILLPTVDSFRGEFLINAILDQSKPIHSSTAFQQNGVLLIGGSGTAKTSSVLMWGSKFDSTVRLFKRINFSSATTPGLFQASIEQDCDNKMGKDYGPPQNKKLAVFIDDMSMPFINKWGDQITLEIVRQLIEQGGFYWLDKAQRGNFKNIRNLSFVGAMNHPGGGRNSIPNRLKRQFFIFNMILPLSIEGIYGPIIKFQFRIDNKNSGLSEEVKKVIENLTSATIKLWQFVKKFMLPTPAKFHYLFNMRQLARTFKGILQVKKQSIMKTDRVRDFKPEVYLIGLWRHECERVFCDKLVNNKDKDTVLNAIHDISIESFGLESEINDKFSRDKHFLFADFLTPDEKDEEGTIVQFGPRNYEAVSDIDVIRKRAYECMDDFNAEPKNTKKLELVLFNDALKHLLKISRILKQPRSSALLVGVGGSGKQSLTRLASFIERMEFKQIQLVKNYGEKDLKEDIKKYFEITGRFGRNCCFILTDSEIKKENFLEFINMILSTGEIPGLLAKDERETFLGDARNDYVKQFRGADPSPSELYNYFVDRIRDNLHVSLCFSPVGQKFRDRFRKFPALFNECTIDWFLPWPQEALVSVAESFIEKFKELDTPNDTKRQLMKHMGNVHLMVTDICSTYYSRMRRQVYFTPKSYLSYLQSYKKLYLVKYKELDQQEANFTIGVNKINEASEAINRMKVDLGVEEKKLQEATEKTEAMLKVLEVQQKEAEEKEAEVNAITQKCEKEAHDISQQKAEAERQLAAALPAQARAQAAVDSLDAASVNEMKANKKPQEILKITLDAIAIYFNLKLVPIQLISELVISKDITVPFWKNSYEESGKFILGPGFDFLKNLKTYDKDAINNQTIELLEPLLVEGEKWFNETTTGKVSKAIAAICKWLFSVFEYHEKSQIVRPRRIKLAQEEANLQIAMAELARSRENLRVIKERVAQLNAESQREMDNKNQLEQQAIKTKKKINIAETLINSLSDEKARWKKGASQIADDKRKLVGNCSLATAFISYCGPFNAEFRDILAVEKFTNDMKEKEIPVLPSLAYELTSFLVDEATVGEWNLQGLPKDTLSVQNAIMVTNSERYPLLIDPQGQGQSWIIQKYADGMEKGRSLSNLNNPRFKDWFLKYCLENGKTLVIEGIENEVDPVLDPVLEKQIVWKRTRGSIKVAGQDMDFDKNFKMFLTCRLPNPSFSPELSAKTTVIDFTVTQGGLEQQLLGRVISHEQKALEDSLNTLLNDVNANKKALQKLDRDLLQRLTESKGNLLDDTELMVVLNNTKTQAKQVTIKLQDAEIKTKEINEKREQYRPVAIRGSALYFTLIELFLINWMYNSSLEQFLELFNWSLAQKSPEANSPQKRVEFIIKTMTKHVHRYVNRGLFEKDKITFMLMICFKILITAKKLNSNDVGAFLKAGAGEDIKTVRQKPQGNQFNFIDQNSWLNIIAFSKHSFGESPVPNFKQLPELITKNQAGWIQYFEKSDPENYPIPDLAERMSQEKEEMRAFMEMYLIRSIREDRTLVAAAKFIASILSQEYIDPISYPMADIWAQSKYYVPILFLLSPGADPTSSIDEFARKKKKVTEKVSMGEGQEQPARKAIKNQMENGGFVILQNCQLGLKFMEQIEQLIISFQNPDVAKPNEEFRLWITCEPHNSFPLGLLQKVLKVTNEPPKGLKAGLFKTFTTLINQQFLEKVDNSNWKNLIFTVCYLHSIVIQRRKFGSLGWCVPYEFNNSDLEASLYFIEKYLNNLANMAPNQNQIQPISTTVLKYMVCDVLYGGRITDDLDRELFATFGQEYIKDGMLNVNEYVYFGGDSKDKNAFKYKMPANPALEMSKYLDYVATIPGTDSPQVFGLDPNADLTFRVKESIEMVNTIMETRPKEASSGGGKTLEEIVKEKTQELLSKMPIDYNENEVRELIRKLSGPRALGATGTAVPLNIFLDQEIARMQKVFNIVRTTLVDVCDAIDGQIIMTSEILDSINAIFDARVPNHWMYDPTGAEISWIIPTLAKWFNDMIERNRQLYDWLKGSRPYTFWLGGFFNPQGFLTGMKQEVTRMHRNPKSIGGGQVQPAWSLDDVVYSTTVKEKDQEQIREGRDKDVEGVYIRELILEGCRWYKNTLEVARPRELFSPLPLLHVTAINKKKSGDDKSVYDCPVYKYAKRTDKYLIFRVKLNSESEPPSKWKLKGVALLCARD